MLKIGDSPETRDRSGRAAAQSDFGTKERKSEGREVVLGTLFKLLVKKTSYFTVEKYP